MIAVAAVVAFGLPIGSFLNVVVHRVPRHLSVVSPPSACPTCGTGIRPRDNVPVLSWLLLRGACRACRAPIPVRYPIVEALTAVLFGVAALRFVPAVIRAESTNQEMAAGVELAAFLFLAGASVALAAIDIDLARLPDAIVLPGYAVGAVLFSVVAVLRGDPAPLGTAAAAAGGAVVLYLVLALAKPGGMGLGDVKLAGVLGLFLGQLGVEQVVVGLAAGFLLGGVGAALLIATGRLRRGAGVPFGPWMLAGAWVGIVAGPAIATWYLGFTGLA